MQLEELINVAIERGRLGHYSDLCLIGQGGFGIVLRAKDNWLRRNVALKFPRDQSLPLDNLLYEARLLAAFAHPNIITIYSALREACTPKDDLLFIVTEYAEGGSLAGRLNKQPLRQSEIIPVLQHVASGLSAAHQSGIIHRDIKPENVLLDSTERPLSKTQIKIADFGISVRLASNSAKVMGTRQYMSPEAWLGAVCPQSDVYSVGVMAYFLLTARFPFDGATSEELVRRVLLQPPLRVRSIRPECSPELDDLVAKCLEKDPSNRPKNGADLCRQLEALNQHGVRSVSVNGPNRLRLAKCPRVSVIADNVLNANCDAIAYSANNRLHFGGGMAGTLLKGAGPLLKSEALAKCQSYDDGILPPGEVVVTSGYDLESAGVRHILHATTLYWNSLSQQYRRQSNEAYLHDISDAAENSCRTASLLSDVKRLGLTLFGLRIGRRLCPDVPLRTFIAANVQGIQRFLLSAISNVDVSKRQDWSIVVSAYSPNGRSTTRDIKKHLSSELRLIELSVGELTESNSEALVISANNWLFPGSGNARHVYVRGGIETQSELAKLQPATEPLARGAVATVPGGDLVDVLGNRRHLIHVVTTWYQHRNNRGVTGRVPASPNDVYNAIIGAVREALRLNIKTLGITLMCARPGYHDLDQSRAPIEMAIATARAVNDMRTVIAGRIHRINFVCPTEQIRDEIGRVIGMSHFS